MKVTIKGYEMVRLIREYSNYPEDFAIVTAVRPRDQNTLRWMISILVRHDVDPWSLEIANDNDRRWLLLVRISSHWPGRAAYYAGILKGEMRHRKAKKKVFCYVS